MDTKKIELIGDNHELFSLETPLRDDAFVKSNDEKIKNIEKHFTKIVDELGLDLNDDSISGTPYRVAKMYVKEIFSGLDPENKPKISLFDNKYNYNKMLIEKNINLNSTCEHHFLPITGKAHVSYISSGKVIGLSKLNRIVQYYSHRPQVQERLTKQIYDELKNVLDTDSVMVVIEAKHMCVSSRGIKDYTSSTVTEMYGGDFNIYNKRDEFYKLLNSVNI
ncbi:MAG: GTP cyclohydrolase I FolE [Bacteroidota bacterium]|jgi:GTP cyclohydrolase I|nr:GTP cyclohydrolase I FolE [Flammeovirgaceae bacterium]MEC7244829.1 GTP cyclohydrolase I FolE [Bacteroidota bacterium]MEC7850898.1 GTP cyclohydrolase I FolE [Bacteroidota bacterium]MEC8679030.1 GTP cyclohydrolase I FolE [Bacteroidota bacterium]MEC8702424.1 GTP cyclohydrolase I FolE [Bacteroidota bacterium]|tara:strand:+ start:1216 stop:1878 length:663 start_codon:yes stop_codon:yes gene_type:complete